MFEPHNALGQKAAKTGIDAQFSAARQRAGASLLWVSILGALLWLAAAAALSSFALGEQTLAELPVALVIGAAAFAVLPALLMLVSGLAAREGARARAEASLLAEAALKMLSPSPAAEAAARRLGTSVRGEIAAMDRCVEAAIGRFQDMDAVIAAQIGTIDKAAHHAQSGAGALSQQLEDQRAALTRIGDALANQAGAVALALSQHRQAVADTVRLAEAELKAADEALDSRISSFAAAASLIADRTEALNAAARTSAESALRLESGLTKALEALAKATSLTDAAKVSSQQAVEAAGATAQALRSATAEAIEEAKRTAALLRSGSIESREAPPKPAPRPREPVLVAAGAPEPADTGAEKREAGSRSIWRQLLAALDEERPRKPEVADALTVEPPRDLAVAGRALLEQAGLRIEGVFSVSALEKIAQASRRGQSARRRAVGEQAPDAVLRLAQLIAADPDARRRAEQIFGREGERMSELLVRGRAPLSAEGTRAFLLIDAAYG